MDNPQIELPRYKCHKEVWALEIERVVLTKTNPDDTEDDDRSAWLHFVDSNYAPMLVSPEYVSRHAPINPGYWVRYDDGYESWSPKEAFEAGYSLCQGQTA